MRSRWLMTLAPLFALAALIMAAGAPAAVAQEIDYFGTNRLEFAPVSSVAKDAIGKGVIDYRGGIEPNSRWRGSFRFSGLEPYTTYIVLIKGRASATNPTDDNSDAPDEQSSDGLCSFKTDDTGKGSCFWYFSGLARLNVVQLREGDTKGARVMQAMRSGIRGSITTTPNRYSPGGEVPDRKGTRRGNGGS
ncbi:MAG: hypothetical protein IT338_12630 [Thermomicrobiales bacterium]|nr:hypothetical protein [Thermomicrobiales bacterium]